ncbi:MAG TPA: hypothetical protein VFX12_06840 [Vicinamibacterales bacterium]|nr:hypothetical protein [Vicinamibacterales bacterium]
MHPLDHILDPAVMAAIDRLAADRSSSASELMVQAFDILRGAARSPAELTAAARALCAAQPAMAGFRTAAVLALQADNPHVALSRLALQVQRAPRAIARQAAELLRLRRGSDTPLRLVTCSNSRPVFETCVLVAASESVRVSCAEGRPALEGRVLAERLAGREIPVDLYTDAGLSSALSGASALVVGADAVTGGFFINKVGTGALAARAHHAGVPVYVLAGREKILPAATAATLVWGDGPVAEVWTDAVEGVVVHNPYFERVSLGAVTAVVTDTAVLAPEAVELATLWPDTITNI